MNATIPRQANPKFAGGSGYKKAATAEIGKTAMIIALKRLVEITFAQGEFS